MSKLKPCPFCGGEAMKPLGHRAYGSIGHLPNSRTGPTDSSVHEGQAVICTEKCPMDYRIIVQEKVDGSCVSAARIGDDIVALTRAGYEAHTSPYEMHHVWGDWVAARKEAFMEVLEPGERICGEWIAQAHGTMYTDVESPFIAFDIMRKHTRRTYEDFKAATDGIFTTVTTLHVGDAVSVEHALVLLDRHGMTAHDPLEGVMYRAEQLHRGEWRVSFLAKYVRHDKQDGRYLDQDIWLWRP